MSFGPFILDGGVESIHQIFSRLFPFSRGLVHEYWAPNIWALYYLSDKVLNVVLAKMGMRFDQSGSGLRVLPEVPAPLTLLLIVLMILPLMYRSWMKSKDRFVELLCICGLIFFEFGFHVHEKAITPYLNILFIFLSPAFIDLAIFVNIVNLLPLLIDPASVMISIGFSVLWILIWSIRKGHAFSTFEMVMIGSGMSIVMYHNLIHPLIEKPQIAFVPLMLNSVWSAAFNVVWIGKLYFDYIVH